MLTFESSFQIFQFTLYGVLKGNKMDFRQSMVAEQSEAVYRKCLQQLADNYKPEAIKGYIFNHVSLF